MGEGGAVIRTTTPTVHERGSGLQTGSNRAQTIVAARAARRPLLIALEAKTYAIEDYFFVGSNGLRQM